MRVCGIGIAIATLICTTFTFGQAQAPSEIFNIKAKAARTWESGPAHVIQLAGPLTITTDEATMSADNAVVWMMPALEGVAPDQEAQIALLGNVRLEQGQAVRTGSRLFVTQMVRGAPRIDAEDFREENLAGGDIYRQALTLRPAPTTMPATAPATQPVIPGSVSFSFDHADSIIAADGKVAYVLTGHVLLTQNRRKPPSTQPAAAGTAQSDNVEHLELRAERAVLFTQLTSLRDLTNAAKFREAEDAVYAAYLEGDVRIEETPGDEKKPSQTLAAERVYYEFLTDRAILTDAVIHAFEPKLQIPIIVRAETIRQLSMGEYRADKTILTTSAFAVPSYSVNARTAYIREAPSRVAAFGNQTTFVAHDAVLTLFQVPMFYLPVAAGTMTERGGPLRSIELGSASDKGVFVKSEWGLFEVLGKLPPADLDISYNVDAYSERGPALGLNSKYSGGFITETTRKAWDFQGDFKSYFLLNDTGTDNLGGDRATVTPPQTLRGEIQWEHQQFFPDDWQAQIRAGYVTDPTYLPEWNRGIFNNGLPHDISVFIKHQRQTEAFSLAVEFQPNYFVTTADSLNNSFPDPATAGVQNSFPISIEELPELKYTRVGDNIGDTLTFFSDNSLAGLQFKSSDASLADYGFRNAKHTPPTRAAVLPGLPALGTTGITSDTVYRADLRQELDWPVSAGQFKVVPYIMGRYTGYTDSPDGSDINRVFAGAGVRLSTAFWKVDDSAESDLFDIHRLRHVVEPELHLFTSIANQDADDVFIYQTSVDQIHDVSAVQLALHQRWQTKRGGPGNWRNVDFLTLNVEANFFSNKPNADELPPGGFRGLFYQSVPEESVPRNSINADVTWRISDTTVMLADLEQNLDQQELATTSIGVAVQRDAHLAYFLGVRYIGQANSTIGDFAVNYQLSTRYSILFGQSYSFSDRESQNTTVTFVRRFDRFFITVGVYFDEIDNETGFTAGIFPEGLGYTASTDQLQRLFGGP